MKLGSRAARSAAPGTPLGAGDVLRYPRAFSRSECATLIELAATREKFRDQFRDYGEVRGASAICWLATGHAPAWCVARVQELFARAADAFEFDVSGELEEFKLMEYRRGNRVAWHVDCGGGPTRTRKLTMTVLLSDPAAFSGGALTLAGNAQELHRDIGDAVIFPSFLAHKVSTVTKGRRNTLIAWAHGTPFR